jgi:GntR family transcriptional regulator
MADLQAKRIIDHYRDLLTRRTDMYGDRLPSIRAIAKEFGVSPTTVQKAMRALQAEGLVLALDREGYQATYRVHDLATLRVPVAGTRLRGEVYAEGDLMEITSAAMTRTDPDAADRLGIATGDKAVCRRGLVRREGRIIRMGVSWFPPRLAELVPELLLAESSSPGSVARIEAVTGRGTWLTVDEFGVDVTGPLHFTAFGFPEGAPVLVRTTVRHDGEMVIEYGTTYFPRNINLRYEYEEAGA